MNWLNAQSNQTHGGTGSEEYSSLDAWNEKSYQDKRITLTTFKRNPPKVRQLGAIEIGTSLKKKKSRYRHGGGDAEDKKSVAEI